MNTSNEQQQIPINVTVDLNKMFEAYNKADFMKSVFVEAITKNPKLFTEAISNYIIMEFMATELGAKTKESVRQALLVKTTIDALTKDRDFERTLDNVLKEEVLAQRELVSNQVKNAIQQHGFKEKTAEFIARTVRERVSAVLGEVCEGCDRDIY